MRAAVRQEDTRPVAYFVPHTHWDREWRYPIWKTRVLLVEMMDQLLDVLDRQPGYRCFVLDGQCSPVEDYLQVRPENRARICRNVASGRLSIGPWYTLPDLYPIDGECLVRNLLKGIRVSKEFGGHLKVGYNSFGWGQTAQFPQIYKEFGIDFIIAAKNVSRARAPHCEYWWEAPDGTRVLSTRLGYAGRANGWLNLYLPVRYGVNYHEQGPYRLNWGKGGAIVHTTNTDEAYKDYFRILTEEAYHPERLKQGIEDSLRGVSETAVPHCRLIMIGCDSTGAMPELQRILRDADALLPEWRFVHGTLEQYAADLRKRLTAGKVELAVVKGELRDGPPEATSANALATRIHIKQLNKKAENLLLRQAEPLTCLMSMMGSPYPQRLVDAAWEYLLKSHPHDSINGVTQDKTADDTAYRLSQAIEIASVLYEEATSDLVRRIDLSKFSTEGVLLVLVNPLPRPIRDVLKVAIDTPQDRSVWDFDVVDSLGRRLDLQHAGREEKTIPVNDPHARPWPFYADRHTVYLDTGDVPAGGYKVLMVVPKGTFYRRAEFWTAASPISGPDISTTPYRLENEFLAVTVAPNGTFDIRDKTTGRSFSGLHSYEDSGDVGDYWIRYEPRQNQTFTSLGSTARIWREENGPLSATLGIEIRMHVPAFAYRPENYIRGESRRSDELVDLVISSWITLKRGARRLEVKTKVINTARDHRLRVFFPTGIQARFSDAAGHFTVDRRGIPSVDPTGGVYRGMQTLPMQCFVDISDGRTGFAVLNNCLTEYEAIDEGTTTLAITLFRAVKNIICTEWRSAGVFPDQHGGQCLRTLEYRYALQPHKGDWARAHLRAEADAFNTPVTAIQTWAHRHGALPPEASLFEIVGRELALSAFKKSADRDSFVIRLFNPTDRLASGKIRLHARIRAAYDVTLNEDRRGKLAIGPGNTVAVKAGPGKVVSVEIEPYRDTLSGELSVRRAYEDVGSVSPVDARRVGRRH